MGGAGEAAALAAQQRQRQQAADKKWQTVLDQHKGGKTGLDGFSTDFESAGGFKGLQKMIENADPGAIMEVSRHWATVAEALSSTSSELGTHVNTMLEHWTGESADNFRASAGHLQESLTNGAQYASNTHFAMGQASKALTAAKQNFPAAPSELDQIGSALGGSSDIQFKQDAATLGLAQAVKKDGGDLSAWEQVHQQAVVVMEQLGTEYNAAAAQLTSTPGNSGVGGETVWPAPPSKDPGSIGGNGGTPRGPGHGGAAGLKPISGGNGGGHDTFRPGQNGGHGYVPGGGGIVGVHGGHGGETPPGIGGTLDGGLGGPKSGVGAGAGLHGGGGVGGVNGLGAGGGRGHGGIFGGGAGGLGGLGGAGGGRLGGAPGGEGMRGAGLGRNKLREGGAVPEGEGAGQGEGMGMGMGGGGMGAGSQNKKKRKARAGYLVEDEETWSAEGASNPGVIDF